MPLTKLNRKYLPAFLFIIDHILEDDIEVDYQKIAEEAAKNKESIDPKTIKRAFELHHKLRKGQLNAAFHRPSQRTLDVLTEYYTESTDSKFVRFSKLFSGKITAHFQKNPVNFDVVEEVFAPEKIKHVRRQKSVCEKCLETVKSQSLEAFMEQMHARLDVLNARIEYDNKIKNAFIERLEERISDLEAKLKQAESVYKKYGPLGLFFVSIDYDEMTVDRLFDDFLEDYSGIEDEEILEDLI